MKKGLLNIRFRCRGEQILAIFRRHCPGCITRRFLFKLSNVWSMMYSLLSVFWFFSLYMLKIKKLSMLTFVTCKVYTSVSSEMSGLDVILKFDFFEINVMILDFIWSIKSGVTDSVIRSNDECEIEIWLLPIHGFCISIMSVFFVNAYSKHEIIVLVDFAASPCLRYAFGTPSVLGSIHVNQHAKHAKKFYNILYMGVF